MLFARETRTDKSQSETGVFWLKLSPAELKLMHASLRQYVDRNKRKKSASNLLAEMEDIW